MILALLTMSCGQFDFGRAPAGARADARPGDENPMDGAVDGAPGVPLDACAPGVSAGQPPGPALVQNATNHMRGSLHIPLSVALRCPPSPGNLLIVTGGDTAGSLSSVTGGGADWKTAAVSDQHNNAEIWYGVVTTPSNEPVTISSDGAEVPQPSLRMNVMEWSGLAPDLAEAQGIGSGNAAGPASASQIAIQSGVHLLIFDVSVDNPNFDSPAGWRLVAEVTQPGDSTERTWSQVTSGPGTQHPEVTLQQSSAWDAAIAAFKAAP